MSNTLRINKNNFIDQTVRISFKFNGKRLFGYKGDTLASALLANIIIWLEEVLNYINPEE